MLVAVIAASLVGCRSDSRREAQDRNGSGAAANRIVLWTGCDQVAELTDAELAEWHDRGIGGFVCSNRSLAGFGGEQDFSGDATATLAGAGYQLQRFIRDSRIVERATAQDIKLWLGIRLVNFFNTSTPLAEWFDDAAWSGTALPKLAGLAGAARLLGFAGLAFDGELYGQDGGAATASWDWDYPGNTHTEAEVRAKVRERGVADDDRARRFVSRRRDHGLLRLALSRRLGRAGATRDQRRAPRAREDVQISFWDGMTSVEGYGPIRFMDATFYKTWHISGASWETALSYNANRLMAYLSRNLSNWSYASSRISISPFAWIDDDVANEGTFTTARPPAYVADQLTAFRKWGMDGAIAVFSYAPLGAFDYTPYARDARAARTGTVDTQRPEIPVASLRSTPDGFRAPGTATDNLAIRGSLASRVRPAARPHALGRDEWQLLHRVPVEDGLDRDLPDSGSRTTVTFTAEDIKGLTTTVTRTTPMD